MRVSEAVNPDVAPDIGPWLPLFARYRVVHFPHDEMVEGTLWPTLREHAPEVQAARRGWEGACSIHDDGRRVHVVLVRPDGRPERRPWALHALLLALTVLSSTAAGAMLRGMDPFFTRFFQLGSWYLPFPTGLSLARLLTGWAFSLPFLTVLLLHEMGHFVAALRHRTRATLPFFIPFPPYLSVIGTLGAFIRVRGPTVRRSVLFDIGAAGPAASFLASIPLLVVGMALSTPAHGYASTLTPYVIQFMGEPIWLGDGLLLHVTAALWHDSLGTRPLLLHPLAFAGWLGLFVTALNLLPIGQLDGGHILYALLGEKQTRVARLFVLALVPLGLLWWGWWGWGAVVLWLHRGRAAHPIVAQPGVPLDGRRTLLAWLAILLFFLTFVPVPLSL